MDTCHVLNLNNTRLASSCIFLTFAIIKVHGNLKCVIKK